MKPNPKFQGQPRDFWAHVRTASQGIGYTQRGTGQIKVPTLAEIEECFSELGLDSSHLKNRGGAASEYGGLLLGYFEHRAAVLNDFVKAVLMDAVEAESMFGDVRAASKADFPIPMNKQKGDKRAPAFFTATINALIAENAKGFGCDYDPRALTTVTRSNRPLRTLARRIDGAFPSVINPIAVWEVKEYYYTTTFGSRVADGVYETLLDGMELEELREHTGVGVLHYLMVDSRYTWWECGRSYLCRIIDMLHMGFVDEVLFGREILERLPVLVSEWVERAGSAR
jgi:hypothetical protein